jgi:hypothetical protein
MNRQMMMRAEEKSRAEAHIEHVLKGFERAQREMDAWERERLTEAMGAFYRGLYTYAAIEAIYALTPADKRSREWRPRTDLADFNLAALRRAFVAGREEPVRLVPHLGTIICN